MSKTLSVLCLFIAVAIVSANEHVSVRVNPPIYSGHVNGHITPIIDVRITPDKANRKLRLEWESDSPMGEYHSTEQDLDGENAPKIIRFHSGSVRFTQGTYTVTATLFRNDGTTTFARQIVTDTAEEGEIGR